MVNEMSRPPLCLHCPLSLFSRPDEGKAGGYGRHARWGSSQQHARTVTVW